MEAHAAYAVRRARASSRTRRSIDKLATLRYAYSVAVENRLLSRDHPPSFKSVMLPEADPRQGFVEPAEFARLRDALPAYLRNLIDVPVLDRLAQGRGANAGVGEGPEARVDAAGNVVGGTLTLQAANAKNGRAQHLPLMGDLLEVIGRAGRTRTRVSVRFPRIARPRKPGDDAVGAIGNFKKSWTTACAKAGFAGLLVHDLRRSGSRNLVRAGVPERVAMAITGHRTRAMFDRYDITSEADPTSALERVSEYVERRATETPKVVPLRKVVRETGLSQNQLRALVMGARSCRFKNPPSPTSCFSGYHRPHLSFDREPTCTGMHQNSAARIRAGRAAFAKKVQRSRGFVRSVPCL